MFMVSPITARKWAGRYREEGEFGMQDRSSKPHRIPGRTPEHVKKKIINLRWRLRLGPAQIAARLGLSTSTVHAVLVRCRVNRLSHIDRVTGEPLRRYEHPHPGSLIHVDVTKFGNIPDGGGHRYVGRQQGARNKGQVPSQSSVRKSDSPPLFEDWLEQSRNLFALGNRIGRYKCEHSASFF